MGDIGKWAADKQQQTDPTAGRIIHHTSDGAPVLSETVRTPAGEGRKDDADKPRWDLLPWESLAQIVDVLTYGARKYAPENWRKVASWRWRYYRAAVGHLASWWLGERIDPESKLPHLAHAACCILFLLSLDRPSIDEELREPR